MSKYFIDRFKYIKVFFVRINSNNFTTKFLFYCLFVFLFCSQYFCRCILFHQFLLRAFSHKNVSQSYKLKHYIALAYFLLQINSLFLLALTVLLLKWHHIFKIYFLRFELYFVVNSRKCLWSNLLLRVFYLTTILHQYLLLFLNHFFYTFFLFISTIFI